MRMAALTASAGVPKERRRRQGQEKGESFSVFYSWREHQGRREGGSDLHAHATAFAGDACVAQWTVRARLISRDACAADQ